MQPANNSVNLDTVVTLSWNKINNAAAYIIQLSTDSNFSTFVINDSSVTDTSKQILGLSSDTKYFWRVASINLGGISSFSTVWNFSTKTITGTEKLSSEIPGNYELYQNYPNPFNPSTTIRYALPNESKVNLTVYNLIGQIVRELKNDIEQAGFHEVNFNAGDLASGIYIYRISAESSDGLRKLNDVKKFILLK